MPSAFIDDGYTLEATLEATNFHPAVSITYRPMLRSERIRLIEKSARAVDDKQAVEASNAVSESLAKHLVKWDVTNSRGEPVQITADNMQKIEPHLFEKIYNKVGQFETETAAEKN